MVEPPLRLPPLVLCAPRYDHQRGEGDLLARGFTQRGIGKRGLTRHPGRHPADVRDMADSPLLIQHWYSIEA